MASGGLMGRLPENVCRATGAVVLMAALLASSAWGAGTRVWERAMPSHSEEEYRAAVAALFESYESETGRRLTPAAEGRVGLNVYTNSGPGLATPAALVRAVVAALEERGYRREDVFLVDISRHRLGQAGLLSRGSEGDVFEGSPVYALETGEHFDAAWYYESPLPPRADFLRLSRPGLSLFDDNGEAVGEDRKSFLPYPLLHEADFWINLPVYTDHSYLGINGAILNATLWNAGNTGRFLRSGSTGPVAAAEMAAIPELRRGWVLNIAALRNFQFIGGPMFHSLYTDSRPVLWMSGDPVLLDALMLREINRAREARGFRALSETLPVIEFSAQLGVGTSDAGAVEWIRLE